MDPVWLHERNNDPFGTPNKHEFWNEVSFEQIGDFKIFERGGHWYGYNVRQNYWMNFASRDQAVQQAQGPRLDMWA